MSVTETGRGLSFYESMAARFDVAAKKLKLDEGFCRYLRAPSRELIVHIPVVMDSGRLEVFDINFVVSSFGDFPNAVGT